MLFEVINRAAARSIAEVRQDTKKSLTDVTKKECDKKGVTKRM